MSVTEYTELLRDGGDPFWVRLRHELVGRGFDPREVALAVSHGDGDCFEYGVVVSSDRRVFEFVYSYSDRSPGEGEIVEWTDMSNRWSVGWPYAKEVEEAFQYLERQEPP